MGGTIDGAEDGRAGPHTLQPLRDGLLRAVGVVGVVTTHIQCYRRQCLDLDNGQTDQGSGPSFGRTRTVQPRNECIAHPLEYSGISIGVGRSSIHDPSLDHESGPDGEGR